MSEKTKNEENFHYLQRTIFDGRFIGASISNIRAPEWAQIKIKEFLDKKKNFLVFCSRPGTGKTYLCSALVEWAIKNFGSNWRYWREEKLLNQLRSSMDTMSGDYLDMLKYMVDDDFLILDDVGSSKKMTDWREEILFATLDSRYNSMKPTVITSNFFDEEFLKNYHPRVHSRLFADENIVIQWRDAVDFRLEQKSNISNKLLF